MSSKADLQLQTFSNRAYTARMKRSSDAVLSKIVRVQARNISVDEFLANVREQNPRLYERSELSFNTWLARFESKRIDELAPDGLPYSLGPKVPKRIKLSLDEVITEYQKDLKASDA